MLPSRYWVISLLVILTAIFATGCTEDSGDQRADDDAAFNDSFMTKDNGQKNGYGDYYDDYCPDYADPQAYEDVTLSYWTPHEKPMKDQSMHAGDIEAVHFKFDHPFHLRKIKLNFTGAGGPVMIRIHPDWCNSWPDTNNDLVDPIYMVLPDDAGEIEIELPEPGLFLMPHEHFWVAYWHYHRIPYLQQDRTSNRHFRNRFYSENWAANNSPFVWGGPANNYMISAEGSYFCERESTYFTEVSEDAGFSYDDMHYMRVAWGDYNNDLYDDVLLTLGGNYNYDDPYNTDYLNRYALMRNNGDGTFTDVTDAAGLNGDYNGDFGFWGDVNNDGYLDLFVGVYVPWIEESKGLIPDPMTTERSTILLNNQDGTFTEVVNSGLEINDGTVSAAAFADYNNDGNLDVFMGAWLEMYPQIPSLPDYLFMGNGDGTFTDVSDAAGIWAESNTPAYGVMWSDYDNDGDQDAMVANYGRVWNRVWQNQGDGTFINVGNETHLSSARYGLEGGYGPGNTFGMDFGDVNNDGYLDAFMAEISHPRYQPNSEWSSLSLNSGPPDWTFTNVTEDVGITCDEGEIDPSFIDFDNDGDLDLFLSDLYSDHYCRMFIQNDDGTFTDTTYLAGISVHDCTNNAWADYDRDGDLDLLTNQRDSGHHVRVFRNDVGQDNNWVTVRLTGTGATTNVAAIGARVTVVSGDLTQIREVQGGKGHASSQASLAVEFGLADRTTIDQIIVDWPGGVQETWNSVNINSFVHLIEGDTNINYDL